MKFDTGRNPGEKHPQNKGKENKITIKANSGLSEEEIQRMVKEAEANAEDDKKMLEPVPARKTGYPHAHPNRKYVNEQCTKDETGENDPP